MSRVRWTGCVVVVVYGCVVMYRISDPERKRFVSSRLLRPILPIGGSNPVSHDALIYRPSQLLHS